MARKPREGERNERGYEGVYSLSPGKRDYSACSASSQVELFELVDHRVYKETETNVVRVIVGLEF